MFLAFEGIENVRDLGGLLRADGARVREGVLLRSGRLEKATEGDIRRLREMGLGDIIDFRDLGELTRAPDREVPGAAVHHLPALPPLEETFRPVDDPTYTAADVRRDFQQVYRLLASRLEAQEAYTAFFRILLASGGRPVLWHCTQGKDRTGVAALLLLTALGIDEDTILREYMLTNRFTQGLLDELTARDNPPFSPDIAREVFLVREENLRLYIRCIELEYGSPENYLELSLGLGPREIETLEKLYLV